MNGIKDSTIIDGMFNHQNPYTWPKSGSVSIRLSGGCSQDLDELCKRYDLTKTQLFERLVFYAALGSDKALEDIMSMTKTQFYSLSK